VVVVDNKGSNAMEVAAFQIVVEFGDVIAFAFEKV